MESHSFNLQLLRTHFPEVKTFEYWGSWPRDWIVGVLPSIFLAELMYRDHYERVIVWDRLANVHQHYDLSRFVWPYNCGIPGLQRTGRRSLAWAVGDGGGQWENGVDEVDDPGMLWKLFKGGAVSATNESWYIQGKAQFFWVFRHLPNGNREVLKVAGEFHKGRFHIACVQRRHEGVTLSQVVHTSGLDAASTTLPLIALYLDDRFSERLTMFHCSLVPQQLLADFETTMKEIRGKDGWIPPISVNPCLYDEDKRYIPHDQKWRRKPIV